MDKSSHVKCYSVHRTPQTSFLVLSSLAEQLYTIFPEPTPSNAIEEEVYGTKMDFRVKRLLTLFYFKTTHAKL